MQLEKAPIAIDPRTLAKLSGLHLRARHIVEGYVAGLHRSPYHGFSIEFAEHREYAPGDDLKYLDWKVFGRTDKFYLKQYEDETNLLCYLVLDVSQSMSYQSDPQGLTKLEYAQCLAAALAWLVLQQQDAVGLATFDSQVRTFIRPASNSPHLKQILHAMESAASGRKTAAGPIFHELAERLKKRGVVVILSDFFDDVPSMLAGLKHFRHRRHDVILLHVLDRAEIEFNFQRPTQFLALEEFPDVLVDPPALKRAYQREFDSFQKSLEHGARSLAMDYVLMRTDRPLDVALSAFLASRMAKVG